MGLEFRTRTESRVFLVSLRTCFCSLGLLMSLGGREGSLTSCTRLAVQSTPPPNPPREGRVQGRN